MDDEEKTNLSQMLKKGYYLFSFGFLLILFSEESFSIIFDDLGGKLTESLNILLVSMVSIFI